MKLRQAAAIATALAAAVASAQDIDIEHGKMLHEAACTACHTAAVYERKERLAGSFEELKSLVSYWQDNLDLQWPDADIGDVTHYLNEHYYHFDCPQRTVIC